MHLAAFLIAGPVIHSHAVWRHPRTTGDFLRPELYQDIARILERAKFDLAFFADRLAMADTYGASLETGVTHGDQDVVRLDPIPVLAMMAAVTQRPPRVANWARATAAASCAARLVPNSTGCERGRITPRRLPISAGP
jgi:hypothetical protein